mgnify:CR=1 FL=1
MMSILLRRIQESHAINEDLAARCCLTPTELAGLLPVDIKVGHAQYTADSLAKFLDEKGEASPLAGAIRDWKVSIELVRSRFGWLELPPSLRRRAHQRASHLLQVAQDKGWVTQMNDRFHLTPQGLLAVDEASE